MSSPFYDPFNGRGKVLYQYPDKCVWYADVDENHTAYCTQTLADPIIEANKASYNESAGKRFGDGKIVASIPLNVYFDKIAPAKKAGDDAYVKRFLNDSGNRAFRTFRGRV